jgi:hypothetical protein
MTSRRVEFFVDLTWVAFAGGYCTVATGYPPGGRFVPLTIGLVALAIGLVQFSGNLITVVRPLTHGERETETVTRSEVASAAWAAGFLVAIFVIGAVPAVFLYFLLYFGLHGRRWLLGLASAIVMTLITWGVFGQLIGINLPAGVFAGLLPS